MQHRTTTANTALKTGKGVAEQRISILMGKRVVFICYGISIVGKTIMETREQGDLQNS